MPKGGIKAKYVETTPMKEPKRVTIEEAGNGFVISCGYGTESSIAKTIEEALDIAKTKMGREAKEEKEEDEG